MTDVIQSVLLSHRFALESPRIKIMQNTSEEIADFFFSNFEESDRIFVLVVVFFGKLSGFEGCHFENYNVQFILCF